MNYKKDFPLFKNHTEFIYCDNAATTQRVQSVLDAMQQYYSSYNANAHRGIYDFAEKASLEYEDSRKKVARFIGAQSDKEIIFTKGATDSINTVAQTWALHHIKKGDEILVTELEHHSNFVPWQMLAQSKKVVLKIVPLNKDGLLDDPKKYITNKTKLVAITHVSNAFGSLTLNLKSIIKEAHAKGAKVLIDGAQAVGYQSVNVQELDCDFYLFSGHKLGGPTGVGVLYVKEEMYHYMKPASFGGGAVFEVDKNFTTLLNPPLCYEPGTPAIAQVIGLGAAVDYLQSIGMEKIHTHTNQLVNQLIDGLEKNKNINLLGNKKHLRNYGHLVSFTFVGYHPHDVAAYLNSHAIAVRAGHHCAQIAHKALNVNASVRVSFWIYNTQEDVNKIVQTLSEL